MPPGFLHGFCTLEDETEVFYKVTSYYSPNHDAGVSLERPGSCDTLAGGFGFVVLSDKGSDGSPFT